MKKYITPTLVVLLIIFCFAATEKRHGYQPVYSGWADYSDGVYTSASPFTLTPGDTVTIPNHALEIRDAQLPYLYDSLFSRTDTAFIGRYGDAYLITVEFKIRPTTGSVPSIVTSFDIGGAIHQIYKREVTYTKGLNSVNYYLATTAVYSLDTYESNGAKPKIYTDNPAEIFDIRFIVFLLHHSE